MAAKNPFFHYFLIVLFSIGIVSVGIAQVNKDFSKHARGGRLKGSEKQAREIMRELSGESDESVRGSLRRPEGSSQGGAGARESRSPSFFERLLGAYGSQGKESHQEDQLERDDRKQLDDLVNSVWSNDPE
ncbi:MAG: hypothetical protein KDD64_10605 [Bdellovibrionales bacterium]|nr:hypothetical protein [Bdellovibrionales bacterium]